MANYDDLVQYIQHVNSLYKNVNNKYDLTKERFFIDFFDDNLWYMRNNQSMQIPYDDTSSYPSYISDNSLDNMFMWNLSLNLKVKYRNFRVVNSKTAAYTELNSLSNYNTENTFVMYYLQNQNLNSFNNRSFLIKFLSSFRNCLAHGGFNKLMIDNKCNEVYLAADKLRNNPSLQLAIRIMDNNEPNCEQVVYNAIEEITSDKFYDFSTFYERNLSLSGYFIHNKVDWYDKLNDNINGVLYFVSSSDDSPFNARYITYTMANTIEDVKTYIFNFLTDEHNREIMYDHHKLIIYLPKYNVKKSKSTIINFINTQFKKMYKEGSLKSLEFNLKDFKFDLNILMSDEFYLFSEKDVISDKK